MTTLICTGSLLSNWQAVANLFASTSVESLALCKHLSTQCEMICKQQFADSNELDWSPFSPGDGHADQIRTLLLSAGKDTSFTWADKQCGLSLDFWQSSIANSSFLLFYSSPEAELGKYISEHPFNETGIEKVIRAWLVRTEALRVFFMNNRSQSLLVNVQSAARNPELLVRAVNEYFGPTRTKRVSAGEVTYLNSALYEYLASSLLLENDEVSELFDEIRSTATVICEQDSSMSDIQSRSRSLFVGALDEAKFNSQSGQTNKVLEEDNFLKEIQVNQLMEELEYCFKSNQDQEEIISSYLGSDLFLKVARQARQSI